MEAGPSPPYRESESLNQSTGLLRVSQPLSMSRDLSGWQRSMLRRYTSRYLGLGSVYEIAYPRDGCKL